MYREIIKEHREKKTKVLITLVSGKYSIGVIENHGPEALLLRRKDGAAELVMKQAIETISVATGRKTTAKSQEG